MIDLAPPRAQEYVQGGLAGQQAEASELANEAEMPLEELLASYGLSKEMMAGNANAPGLHADEGDEEEEEEDDEDEDDGECEVDEETATKTAKGWYDTLGPFSGTYEMVPGAAFRNAPAEVRAISFAIPLLMLRGGLVSGASATR